MNPTIPDYSLIPDSEFHVQSSLYQALRDARILVRGEVILRGASSPEYRDARRRVRNAMRSGGKQSRRNARRSLIRAVADGGRIRGARFDIVAFRSDGKPACIIEVKDGHLPNERVKGTYKTFGVPTMLVNGMSDIPTAIEKVIALVTR